MVYIEPENWKPIDNLELEPAALEVVTNDRNYSVVAGPGAGKTELLAQRASFLLQTGTCIYPRKVLALSYKKDAEKNIKERVSKRVGVDLATRFVSLTYDAFAKGILDRFISAIPEPYRPEINYQILNIKEAYEAFYKIKLSRPQYEILFNEFVRSIAPLPAQNPVVDAHFPRLVAGTKDIWLRLLKGEKDDIPSTLTFPMIAVVAEYIVRSNPKIQKSLALTYSHIFLDEFQDTTLGHYNLVKTCFKANGSIITAVGDEKQRIMTWAGACPEVFDRFHADFQADEKELMMNFRSAPRLIEIQKVFMNELFNKKLDIHPNPKWKAKDGECEVWLLDNEIQEADNVADKINKLISEEKIAPRDICIIVRQKPEDYVPNLIKRLTSLGICARNENEYQDLLSEMLPIILLNLMSLGLVHRSPDAYVHCVEITKMIHGVGANIDYDKKSQEVDAILAKIRAFAKNNIVQVNGSAQLISFLKDVLDQLGAETFYCLFPQYKKEDFRESLYQKLGNFLWLEYSSCGNWKTALKNIQGENTIPIMTIHKSKGLEYNTIIFIGLEDQAFWNFKKQTGEEIRNFFVALSRAKQRVLFTFANERKSQQKSRTEIKSLYDILRLSGVVTLINFHR